MHCTTEPMLRPGHAGNGLHIHLSPVVGGLNLDVRDDGGGLAAPARWLIGGLVETGAALMAFGNRSPESFGRLTQGKEAPNTIVWGEYDRKALIRLPVVARTADGRHITPPTVEFRLPDGSAHPHLLLAGIAQAMVQGRSLDGLDELLSRTTSHPRQEQRSGTPVPRSFAEVADTLIAHRKALEAGDVFPSTLINQVAERLRAASSNPNR